METHIGTFPTTDMTSSWRRLITCSRWLFLPKVYIYIYFFCLFGSIFWSASCASLFGWLYLTMAAVRRRWMEGVYAHAPGPDSCKSYTPGWNICWRTNLWEFDLPLSCSEEHRPPLFGRCLQQAPVFHHGHEHETAFSWSSHVLVCLSCFFLFCFFFTAFYLLYFIIIIYYCPSLISSLLCLVERNLDLKICLEWNWSMSSANKSLFLRTSLCQARPLGNVKSLK